jgi:hypothetical protein
MTARAIRVVKPKPNDEAFADADQGQYFSAAQAS